MDTTFFVEIKGTCYAIKFDDVLYIFSTGNESKIITKKKKYNVAISLDAFEDQLPDKLFCKVHPFFIAAVKNIDSFSLDNACFGDISIPISDEGFQNIVNRRKTLDRESGKSSGNWQLLFQRFRESGSTNDN